MEAHKKFAGTGKFSCFISNVQRNDQATIDFLKKANVPFPVYNQVRLNHAPCGRGIPHAVLLDHTGKVVKQGFFPDERLYAEIEKLIAAAPGTAPKVPPILGDVEVKHCRSEARALGRGEAIKPVLDRLDRYAERESGKGTEAKALAAAVREYVANEAKRLVAIQKERPATAAFGMGELLKRAKGMPEEETLLKAIKAMVKDKHLVALVKIVKALDKAKAKHAKKATKSTARKLKSVMDDLESYAKGDGPSAALKAEAKALGEEAEALLDE